MAPPADLRHPQLIEIRSELDAASARAVAVCKGLDEEALGWRPALEALHRFLDSQKMFAARLAELEGIDLARATCISPIARYIRMNLLAFLKVHTAHERRHLRQAENVRKELGKSR